MGFYRSEVPYTPDDNKSDGFGGTLTVSTDSAVTNVLRDGEGAKLNRKQRRREAARWRKHKP